MMNVMMILTEYVKGLKMHLRMQRLRFHRFQMIRFSLRQRKISHKIW